MSMSSYTINIVTTSIICMYMYMDIFLSKYHIYSNYKYSTNINIVVYNYFSIIRMFNIIIIIFNLSYFVDSNWCPSY